MRYNVLVIGNHTIAWIESNSRNAKKHLTENGAHTCKVFNNQGVQLSEYRSVNGYGYYCEILRKGV